MALDGTAGKLSLWNGWQLTATLSLLLGLMVALTLWAESDRVEAIRLAIRMTARTSLLIFVPVFMASSLYRLRKSGPTRWLLLNRRYLGLSFAASHALHLGCILALQRADPTLFDTLTSPTSFIGGGLAYVLIALMALTSFDGAVKRMGARNWRFLHLTGMWVIWLIFTFSNGGRAVTDPAYLPAVAFMVLGLGVRILGRRSRRLGPISG